MLNRNIGHPRHRCLTWTAPARSIPVRSWSCPGGPSGVRRRQSFLPGSNFSKYQLSTLDSIKLTRCSRCSRILRARVRNASSMLIFCLQDTSKNGMSKFSAIWKSQIKKKYLITIWRIYPPSIQKHQQAVSVFPTVGERWIMNSTPPNPPKVATRGQGLNNYLISITHCCWTMCECECGK